MKLLAVAGDITSLIAGIRLVTPLQALVQAEGGVLQLRSMNDCTRADLAAADVLVMQRGASRRAWRLQQAMRQRGGAVVAEIDDLLTALPPHISHHAAMQAQVPWVRRCLATADGVTVSTARLGRELGISDAWTVPNYALSLGSAPLPLPVAGRPATLLLASMDRLAAAWLVPALRALQADGVEIVVVGPAGPDFAAAGLRVNQQALMVRPRFLEFARGLPNVVAVIPLEDSRFAACKSAIKWFEYGEAGIPVLCSNVSPYREVVAHGITGGLVDNDVGAWQVALRSAVADAEWRTRVATAARAVVRQRHTLDLTVAAWQVALEAAVRRRAATALANPTLAWRLQEALAVALERSVLRLRAFNRARLARRKQARR